MTKPRIGLLPLYLELYDASMPELHGQMEAFVDKISSEMETRGISMVRVPICRLSGEFHAAVQQLEDSGADAIVTLHLAYSPSLESIDALASTRLPIVVLDTTPTFSFGPTQNPDEIMFNHGIHGVQDLCNLLIRRGKKFALEVGHWEKSDVLDRVASWCRAAKVASSLRSARVGRIGPSFAGMGDFDIPSETLKAAIGMETVACTPDKLRALVPDENESIVGDEIRRSSEVFDIGDVSDKAHRTTVRAGIAIRRWIEQERLTAFSMNFMAIDSKSGLPTVPFVEAGNALVRGLGYAGEGDVLTAGLVGALLSVYPHTTFTEMFCPDWENDTVFLSHMGEMNYNLADSRVELVEKPFPWTDAEAPLVPSGRYMGGSAVLIDLAPGPDDTFALVISPVEMLSADGKDMFSESVRGWFSPSIPLEDFLRRYSEAGGTHHLALVYGADPKDFCHLAGIMGWKSVILD